MNTDTPEIDQINNTEREIDMRRRITAWQNQTINDLACELDEAREQRDRLADALQGIAGMPEYDQDDPYRLRNKAAKALQSLTTNTET